MDRPVRLMAGAAADALLPPDPPPAIVDERPAVDLLAPGAAKPMTELDIAAAAESIGLADIAALKAVLHVESSGKGFFKSGFPKIRPEIHVFHRQTNDAYRDRRFVPVSAPEELFKQMLRLDERAALMSTSYGVGQIMGFNFELAGCASPEQLLAEAKESGAAQLRHMMAFLRATRLDGHLRALDWPRFALGYNGPRALDNDYHGKVARRYQRIAGVAPWSVLSFGARGAAVERLQAALTKAGFPADEDGHFGPQTEAAVRAFQRDRGQPVDGVAGARTWEGLRLVEAAERDRASAPPAPPAPDDTLDEVAKVVGVGSGLGAVATSGANQWIAAGFAALVLVLVGVYFWRKLTR